MPFKTLVIVRAPTLDEARNRAYPLLRVFANQAVGGEANIAIVSPLMLTKAKHLAALLRYLPPECEMQRVWSGGVPDCELSSRTIVYFDVEMASQRLVDDTLSVLEQYVADCPIIIADTNDSRLRFGESEVVVVAAAAGGAVASAADASVPQKRARICDGEQVARVASMD